MQLFPNQQPVLLCIAGSDPSAGAGIQADIKTAAALQVYACTAITALTAQNGTGVHSLLPVPVENLNAQIECLLVDHRIGAIKLGALADLQQVQLLGTLLAQPALVHVPVVMDTPLAATAGQPLSSFCVQDPDYRALLARATVVTPNLSEAALISRQPLLAQQDDAALAQAQALLNAGAQAVLLKGGHRSGAPADLLLKNRAEPLWFRHTRIATRNHHGTGCTLATAVAVFLLRRYTLEQAVALATDYVQACLRRSAGHTLSSSGFGPLWHFDAELPNPSVPAVENAPMAPVNE